MNEFKIVVKKFLCDYCKCIFVASRSSYQLYDIGLYEKGYKSVCPVCHRVATQVLGTEFRTVYKYGKKLMSIDDLREKGEEKS